MQKIVTFLWFDGQAEEAVKFYTSVFKDSKIITIACYPDSVPGFEAAKYSPQYLSLMVSGSHGASMAALNSNSMKPSHCSSTAMAEQEIDYFWNKLIADGGRESQCGWLKDKYGLSWQVVLANMGELMQPGDAAKGGRAVQALMKMSKINIKELAEA